MRYLIGIDLGTTNSCIAYAELNQPKSGIQLLRIPQLVAPGQLDALPTLPSFCYLTDPKEWPPNSLKLFWESSVYHVVGQFAKEQGSKTPTKMIQSAKSWLCHSAANRRDKILPLEAADITRRLSPVEASSLYLKHIKNAWDYLIAKGDPEAEFESQDIVLTVPASFDEVARTLTLEAAKLAGFSNITLLEEPQAAFYSWIARHEETWQQTLKLGEYILVCDVGGGTSDFSLMEVTSHGGKLSIQRMAVGDHLLLGGDNMDASIAHFLERKLHARELSTSQWLQLLYQGRQAKEKLLAPSSENKKHPVWLQGSGSQLVAGSLSVEIEQSELEQLLLDGFFGQYTWDEANQLQKAKGLRNMGLPYEDEPAITKHLAKFLSTSRKKPDYILFNGGVMKATSFQKAILNNLAKWFPEKQIEVLPSFNLDLAVAYGAAYYAKVRQGQGVKIGGGTARGYYLGINLSNKKESEQHAMTLLPRGSEEESQFEPPHVFSLTPNTPVAFQLYTSHVRLDDHSGDLITIDPNEMQLLPPIHTILRFGKQQSTEKIPVRIVAKLTAIGTLAIWLQSQQTDHKWTLEFQLRTASGQENYLKALNRELANETFDVSFLNSAKEAIQDFFSAKPSIDAGKLTDHLEKLIQKTKLEWPSSILRGLADQLLTVKPPKMSQEKEIRWWNLLSFCLRPGFGFPLDDFRLKELWKIILAELKTSKSSEYHVQKWICYRRIAGGLNRGQQIQLSSEVIPTLWGKHPGLIEIKNRENYFYSEKIRMLGALELLDIAVKIKLGEALLDRMEKKEAMTADFWALGRIGARHLFYGSAAYTIPVVTVSTWIQKILKMEHIPNDQKVFLLGQLGRKTDQRELNIPQSLIEQVMANTQNENYLHQLLQEVSSFNSSEKDHIFGDALPIGLSL